ncbi:MAG TPA: TolC family protein [Cyclobacteriaceae bacterium]|nr:TolC family protein [Cyclobacteriaceae bacterium]
MHKRLILGSVLFLFSLTFPDVSKAQVAGDSIWTLEECIDVALRNNLIIRGSMLSVEDNRIALGQSRANVYPSLNAGGSYSNLWGRSVDPTTNDFSTQRIESSGLQGTANFTIYGGFRKRNTINQNKSALMASNYDLETDKNDVMLDVTTAFLNVILDFELLENARMQFNTTQAQLETTSKQVKAGALPYSNELDLIAQVESNKVQVIIAENDLRLAELRLKQLLLIPSDESFEVEIPEINDDRIIPDLVPPDEAYATAEQIMPQVKSADLNVQGAGYGVKIARGYLDPILTANVNMYTNYSSVAKKYVMGDTISFTAPIGYFINPFDNTQVPVFRDISEPSVTAENYAIPSQFKDNLSQSLGLTLQIPIFNGLSARSNYQRAKIQSERVNLQAQQIRLQLRQNIELAYNNALAASQTFEASKKQVTSLEESFRATQKSYDLGARSYFDYQVASNNLFRARSDLLRAKYNFIFTQKVLDFYVGKPITLEN